MPNIFISGAASGLGKAFCHAYALQLESRDKIYVLDRVFDASPPFLGLPKQPDWIHEHIIPIECDITDAAAVAEKLRNLNVKLDLVIHSVGVRGLVPEINVTQYADVAKAESMDVMDSATLMRTFEINSVGTFLLLRALLPYLQRSEPMPGREITRGSVQRHDCAKVVVMGSRMGSIGHNTELGGAYAYRASKAALNAIIKSFSVDVPEVMWTMMHPGRVETGLVKIKEDAAMNADEIIQELLPLIDSFTTSDSGRFVDRFGKDIPW